MLIIIAFITFLIGVLAGKEVSQRFLQPKKDILIDATIPLAVLIAEFEGFARGIEGGALSADSQAALNMLKAHAEQKCLKASKQRTFPEDARKSEWSDVCCFEKEIAKATSDNERISIIQRCMQKYFFTQPWQTWCIHTMISEDGRDRLRKIFETQE